MSSILPGTRLGGYEVRELLGRGAMGMVYRAYHEGLDREAAVKVLQALAPDPDALARFRREAQAIAQTRHPNIVAVYDFGEHEGTPYMVVEYVAGGSLADRLRTGSRPDLAHAVELLRGMARALDHAHSKGIIHRDVKPGNVLLGPEGGAILADFGLAKLTQRSSAKTVSGVTTGTPAYMAPEQVMGKAVTPAADCYALATVAYELLTGDLPFGELGVFELLYAHVHSQPAAPTVRNWDLPAAIDPIILKGLAKDPESRWRSCGAMVDALARVLTEAAPAPAAAPAAALATPRAPVPAITALVPVGTPQTPPTVAAPPRPGRRLPLLLGGAAVATLAVLAVAGFLISRPGPSVQVAPATAAPGQMVAVSAQHLPANQDVNIYLEATGTSQLATSRADSRGDLLREVRVPAVSAGEHRLLVCWNGTCPAITRLRVSRA